MCMPPSLKRRAMACLVAGVTAVAVTSIARTASASPSPHAVPDSAPRWTGDARVLGNTAANQRVDFGVLLKMRDQAGAVATLQKLSDPDSASYGKWLTKDQFTANYGPAKPDVAAVRSWLGAQGFTLRKTLQSGLYVEASGSVAQVQKVFKTTVKNYSYRGQTVHSNASALSFPSSTPSAVINAVGGILGIDQGSQIHTTADTLPGPPPGVRFGVQPCSDYYGQKVATDKPPAYGKQRPYAVCGYGP